jgi:DNA-binding response OmpR family regulator
MPRKVPLPDTRRGLDWAEVSRGADCHTCRMGSPPVSPESAPPQTRPVTILVLDDDAASAAAVRQVLDSEGWRVRVVPDTKFLLSELKGGDCSLVIANVAVTGVDTPLFSTLKELGTVPVDEGGRLRVLYLVPEFTGGQYVGSIEAARVPYVVRPYHLHDFLEKISDLLVEVKAIDAPIRQVRHEFGEIRKKKKQAGRTTSMFASRDTYSYSDEEIAEYERAETEASKQKKNRLRTDLGGRDR